MLKKRSKRSVSSNNFFKKTNVVIGLSLLFILMISVIFYFFRFEKDIKRTLFFPSTVYKENTKIVEFASEIRTLPLRKNEEDNIRLFVEEVLLGPINLQNARIMSRKVKLLSLILRDDILYINLSGEVFVDDKNIPFDMGLRIKSLGNNILFNFRNIKDIRLFVEGQVPDFNYVFENNPYNFDELKGFNLENIK